MKLVRTLGLVPWTLEVGNVKAQPYRDTKGPGRDGFVLMLDALDKRKGHKAIRDRAILRMLFDLALRRAEVAALDVEDVDIEGGTVAVMGKGRTEKIRLTLPPETQDAIIREWIAVGVRNRGPCS